MSESEEHNPYEDTTTSIDPESVSQDERNLGMLCHLVALVGLVIPLGNVLGPLVVWLIKRDDSRFVDLAGKEALNFNITVAIAGFVSALLIAVFIGVVLVGVVFVYWLVFAIIAAIKASSGEHYAYPLTIRFLQ